MVERAADTSQCVNQQKHSKHTNTHYYDDDDNHYSSRIINKSRSDKQTYLCVTDGGVLWTFCSVCPTLTLQPSWIHFHVQVSSWSDSSCVSPPPTSGCDPCSSAGPCSQLWLNSWRSRKCGARSPRWFQRVCLDAQTHRVTENHLCCAPCRC